MDLQINQRLLPCKIHYFLFSGGQAGVLPFLPVLAKHLGVSPEVVGILYTILPLVPMIFNPLTGVAADKLGKLKLVMMVSLGIFTVFIFSIIFLPLHPEPDDTLSTLVTPDCSSSYVCSTNGSFVDLCDAKSEILLPEARVACNLTCVTGSSATVCAEWGRSTSSCSLPMYYSSTCSINTAEPLAHSFLQLRGTVRSEDILSENCSTVAVRDVVSADGTLAVSQLCFRSVHLHCGLECTVQADNINLTSESSTRNSLYMSFTFWWLCISMVFSWIALGTVTCLTDAIILDNLGEQIHQFGLQRLWGTIGGGVVVILTGYLNEKATEKAGYPDYTLGFYIFLGMLTLDQYAIYRMEDSKQPKPQNIGACVAGLLRSAQIMVFLSAFFVIGVLVGILESFQFWYLEDLGANQLLLGLTRGIQFFGGEMPSFIISGWVIGKIGYVNTVTLVLAVYGVRYIGYSFLVNPWVTLPLELTHGAYGIFYSAMAAYASVVAPPGMSATMQAVVGAMYEGAGLGVGSLLGGFLYGSIGGRLMFLILGLVAVSYSVFHGVVQFLINKFQIGETDIHGKKYNAEEPSSPQQIEKMLPERTTNERRSIRVTTNQNGDVNMVTSV